MLPDAISLHLDQGDATVPGLDLWLDPHRPRDFAFVSHAHSDHFAAHGRILCSEGTRHLVESRYRAAGRTEFVSAPFGKVFAPGPGWTAEFLPAGHIPGSAMLWLRRDTDGATLLHTGDFKTRIAPGAETNQVRRADTLVMETTFGLPRYRFPPSDEVLDRIVRWCREAIEDSEVPILMAYSLGKAQELLLSIRGRAPELHFQVHESVLRMNEAVAALGFDLPPCEGFDPKERSPAGAVVILPPSAGRSLAVRRMRKSVRLAMVSGWGMDPGAKFRYQCDEVFPLSDHAGYDDLLAFVSAVAPTQVHTIHGFAAEFAADLRRRGYEAWPLAVETQMELDALVEDEPPDLTGSDEGPDTVESTGDRGAFGALVRVCEEIAGITGKLGKRDRLAAYLSSLEADDLPRAVRYLCAQPLSRQSTKRAANVGWALIRQALLDLTGIGVQRLRQISSTQADSSRTTWIVLQGKTEARPHSLADLETDFETLAAESSQSGKVAMLRRLLSGCHHADAALIVGILTGDLRIGLKEGLVEEAVAAASGAALEGVREANMLLGDLGETAVLARRGELHLAGATWFTPLRVMLASPGADAEELHDRLGGEGRLVWLEDKYDGIRAQLHARGGEAGLYSRDLRPLEAEFPELIESAKQFERSVILDGEIIARAEGRKLSFFDLQKRLGRRDLRLDQGDLFFGEAVPVRFVAFDLLGIDGIGCLDRPLAERRSLLQSLRLPPGFDVAEVFHAASAAEIDEHFNAARRRDNEGLIAKDPASLYTPGRRGKQWLKLKKAMPTLDVVVVKAQQGHGKRSHVLSDYTFAVRDEESGALRVIGKAYSGLTDAEIEELTEHFRERTIEKQRGVHTVEPDVVLEIAFDSIQASKRHDSGLSLRFPRIHAIRRDKDPGGIDTLAYARRLAGL